MEQADRQIVLVTYADERYKNAKKLLVKTAKKNGFQRILDFDPTVLDEEFRSKNRETLSQKKGGGYWLWKPYVIEKALDLIEENDILVYCDAGIYFCGSIQPLAEELERRQTYMIAFDQGLLEKAWTKRDVFLKLDCDSPAYTDTPQMLAGFIVMKCCDETRALIHEWLELMQVPGLATDEPSKAPNYPDFVENRHDLSIFSLLVKKEKLPALSMDSLNMIAIHRQGWARYKYQIRLASFLRRHVNQDARKQAKRVLIKILNTIDPHKKGMRFYGRLCGW